jgi:hypothetical protein
MHKIRKGIRMLRFIRRLAPASIGIGLLLSGLMSASSYAATTSITGGTDGPNCNSGGYFTPSSTTASSGDTVTISVPSNDPYAGGLEIHGFPQGNFTVARGGSVTTSAITSSVSYYGTWPSTSCMKGSGTITVNSPVSPSPSPTPISAPAGPIKTSPPVTQNTTGGTSTNTTPAGSKTASQTATPQAQAGSSTTGTSKTSSGTLERVARKKNSTTSPTGGTGRTVAVVGSGALLLVAVAAFIAWFMLRRRSHQ